MIDVLVGRGWVAAAWLVLQGVAPGAALQSNEVAGLGSAPNSQCISIQVCACGCMALRGAAHVTPCCR